MSIDREIERERLVGMSGDRGSNMVRDRGRERERERERERDVWALKPSFE